MAQLLSLERPRTLRCASMLAAGLACGLPNAVPAAGSDAAGTFYVARLTTVNAWHDIVKDPAATEFADAYVAVAAVSDTIRWYRDGSLSMFREAQAAYNFGDQSHWEFNFALGPRWHDFPWSDNVETTAAFGIGLSYATEVPDVEVALEDSSEQLLIYWVMELTFGPPGASWDVSLRLHHRSTAFGLLADEGGMNALGIGMRYEF